MISKKVLTYLDKQKIPYVILDHRKVYTAFDAAQTMKVKLRQLIKTLLIRADKLYYLVSVPADKNVDLSQLKKVIKVSGGTVKKIALVKENALLKTFKLQPGGLTSFGSHHKVQAVIDQDIKKLQKIIVSGGSLTQSIEMKVKDFIALGEPIIARIGKQRAKTKKKTLTKRKGKTKKK